MFLFFNNDFEIYAPTSELNILIIRIIRFRWFCISIFIFLFDAFNRKKILCLKFELC